MGKCKFCGSDIEFCEGLCIDGTYEEQEDDFEYSNDEKIYRLLALEEMESNNMEADW